MLKPILTTITRTAASVPRLILSPRSILRDHLEGFLLAILLFGFIIVVFGVASRLGWNRSHVTPFDTRTTPLAEQAARQFADEIPAWRQTGLNPIVIYPFTGPKGHILADALRDAIDAAGIYDVIGKGAVEATLRGLNIDDPQFSETDARRVARRHNAQAFVTGTITELDSRSGTPTLAFKAVFAATDGDFRWEFAYPSPTSTKYASEVSPKGAGISFLGILGMGVAFLSLCLATPFLLYPLTRNLLGRDSNLANAVMLFGYALADVIALRVALWDGRGGWIAFLIAVGFVVALWLNYCVCSWLEREKA
jgi:hypothetical protein